jgi:hypothetical protein
MVIDSDFHGSYSPETAQLQIERFEIFGQSGKELLLIIRSDLRSKSVAAIRR